ncbi:MlaD family protein [Gordonia terrae]
MAHARGRRRGGPHRSSTLLALCVAAVAALTGCSLDPASLALSAQSSGDGKTVTVMFANALNLPKGAIVTYNGVNVGRVTDIELGGREVRVETKIRDDILIPESARATLQQSTVLGDPSVAIVAEDARPGVPHTDSIPIERTSAPTTLEDTLAVVANFINGGSVQNLESIIRTTNKSFPDLAQTRRVADIVAVDARDLGRNTARLDEMLAAIDGAATTLIPEVPELANMLTPLAMHRWDLLLRGTMSQVSIVLPSIGSVYQQGFFLVPVLNELNKSVGIVRNGIDGVALNEDLLRRFLSEKLFPFIRKPDMKIVSVTSPQGAEVLTNAEMILRMLGAVQ